jgi:hypothetical protein
MFADYLAVPLANILHPLDPWPDATWHVYGL